MNCSRIVFSAHALKAIISRSIEVDQVEEAINEGEVIADYPTDKPYPSKLLLRIIGKKPIHVVVAQTIDTKECIVVTCYIPDPLLWDSNFKQKIR